MDTLQNGIDFFQSGNYAIALQLLQPLADRDRAEAQCIIASMYHLGLGVDKNGPEAVKWYVKSARQGYPVAANNLAGIYAIGDCGVRIDREEAAKWRKLSEEQGFLQ